MSHEEEESLREEEPQRGPKQLLNIESNPVKVIEEMPIEETLRLKSLYFKVTYFI